MLLLALALLAVNSVATLIAAVTGIAAFVATKQLEQQAATADAVRLEGSATEVIDALPAFPDFTIRDPDDPSTPDPQPGAGGDSPEAARFKLALKDTHRLIAASANLGRPPTRDPIDISALTNATFSAINPDTTIPAFTLASVSFPLHFVALNGEVFREAMAYPEFDIPMYKPLLGLSAEHFLPNIDKIPQNTITLLETNQRFIEAYMVGLNIRRTSAAVISASFGTRAA